MFLFCRLLSQRCRRVIREGGTRELAICLASLTFNEVLLAAEDGHLDRAIDVFVAQVPQVGTTEKFLLSLSD